VLNKLLEFYISDQTMEKDSKRRTTIREELLTLSTVTQT